jgi:hypothetical protein
MMRPSMKPWRSRAASYSGVLGDVALRAGLRDRRDHLRAFLALEAVELGAHLLGTDEGDRYFHVGSVLCSDWMS